jgi:hypothetical protein
MSEDGKDEEGAFGSFHLSLVLKNTPNNSKEANNQGAK